jgi:tRNA U55 pseudouridine synthase TruB
LNHNGKGIYTIDEALSWIPEIKVKSSSLKRIKNGNPLTIDDIDGDFDNLTSSNLIKIKSPDNELLAIGSYRQSNEQNLIKLKIVLC